MIQEPLKVWIPKTQNRYIHPYYENDIHERVFYFQQYKKSVYRTKPSWEEVGYKYLIIFNDEEHNEELYKHIELNISVIPEIK